MCDGRGQGAGTGRNSLRKKKGLPGNECLRLVCYLFSCLNRVFYRRHKQVRDVIKLIVLHMLFDSQHLENYLLTKIRQFSSNVHVVDNIQQALNSPETEKIIEERLDTLYSLPEAHYLEVLGLSKEQLRPIIKPSVISLCAESAPMVLTI